MTYEDLSIEQKEFIDLAKSEKNIWVDACIGAGKTTAIQVLCNELPGKDILYLTYNRLLKLDAKEKIKNENVTVTNYNGFVYWCLSRAGVRCGLSDQFQTYNKILPPTPKHFDLLLIDEYQDIEAEMVPMLNRIKAENPNIQIIAVGDMAQKIYDKTVLDVPKFMNEYLGPHENINFTRCFRLSADIAAMYGRIWEKSIIGVNKTCKVEYMTESEAVKFLKDKEPKDILCLGARKGSLSKTLNVLESKYPDRFNKKTVYASISDDRGSVDPDKDAAIFTTYDSSKGMERKYCLVFDYNEEYWSIRSNQPNTKVSILKNIFCVAGSRGKDKIIFVQAPKKHMLSEDTLRLARDKSPSFKKPFQASSMFDFKYKEDIEECFSLLKIKRVKEPETIIEAATRDDMIDLSPCLGEFQEASFFNNYYIDKEIKLAETIGDTEAWYRTDNPDLQEKILSLTAMSTHYMRYIKQASLPFVEDDIKDAIENRLSQILSRDEIVQSDCSITVKNQDYGDIVINGRCDVERKDSIFELKFIQELSHEHFLQLAFYLCAKDRPIGFLWNVRNNEIYAVQKPKRKEFIKTVVKCITKHEVTKCKIKSVDNEMKNLDKFKKKKNKHKTTKSSEDPMHTLLVKRASQIIDAKYCEKYADQFADEVVRQEVVPSLPTSFDEIFHV